MSLPSLSERCDQIAQWLTEANPQAPDWPPEAWAEFRRICQVHGIAALLHSRLNSCDWLEADCRDWLANQYRLNCLRLAKIQTELKAILTLFQKHKLPIMPMKGSILAAQIYPTPGLRPMADLDLLIHPTDFKASAALLQTLGYEPDVAHWKHTAFSKADNRTVVDPESEHPNNPRGIELHLHCRETFGGPTLDLTNWIWGDASLKPLLGAETYLPTLARLWLHLLVHATYHIWQGKARLIHLYDLWLLTPHISEPNRVLGLVDARYTYPALALGQHYFPSLLDEITLQDQATPLSPSFRDWVANLDLVNTSHLNPDPSGLYFTKALRYTEGRPREVVQALRFSLLPSLDELALDHPKLAQSKISWLAYFLLPLDWAKRLRS